MGDKFADWLLKLLGWRVEAEEMPFPKKYIICVIPHTSNWDFPLGLIVRRVMRQKIGFVGKDSLFRFPFGGLFRRLGGYPVDRRQSHNYVESVASLFRQKEELAICIAPEGTRSKVDKIKTGFYYIAKSAGIPILLCKFDYATKCIGVSKPFYPTEDTAADFKYIYDYFRGVKGKIPENGFLYNG